MQKIQSFSLKNFKYFFDETVFDVGGKNLLIYGQNGSGKSSIYWALYTFLQSAYKPDVAKIQKYFDRTKEVNLVNRFAPQTADSSITLSFVNEHQTVVQKQISYTIQNVHDGTLVKESAQASDFLNYRALSKFYNFTNGQKIDLFSLFESDFMQFISFGVEIAPGSPIAIDAWRYIKGGLVPRPNMHTQAYRNFQALIQQFNDEFRQYIGNIVQSANDIFRSHFGNEFRILIEYKDASYDNFIPNSTTKRDHATRPPEILLFVEFNHALLPLSIRRLNRPHTFLNEARLSAISLCIRLAILEQKYLEPAAKMLVIDDLIISLDMENRDQVLDLILNRYLNYQLILMTHDRSFFNLAKNRILSNGWSNSWLIKEIFSDETSDGVPRPVVPADYDYLEHAKKYIKGHDYPASANYLRKETESLLKGLLPSNLYLVPSDDGTKPAQLDTLIENFRKHLEKNGGNFGPFLKLKEYKDLLLNPFSHDNIHTPIYKSELLAIIGLVELLRKMKFVKLIDISKPGNEFVYLTETDSAGIVWSYKIELLENISCLRLVDGSKKFGDPECKFIERMNPTLVEAETLERPKMRFTRGYREIRHALNLSPVPQPQIETILFAAAGTLADLAAGHVQLA